MPGRAATAFFDLMTAGKAIGQHRRVGRGAQRRQQIQLGHGARNIGVLGVQAKAAGHAATAGVDKLKLAARNQTQHLAQGFHRPHGFLVAMAVHQHRRLRPGFELPAQPLAVVLAGDEFFKQKHLARHLTGVLAQTQLEVIIAQRQDARRLQPDNRRAAGQRWRQRGMQPAGFFARGVHLAQGQIGAATAQRPRRLGVVGQRAQHMHLIAGGVQHRLRRHGDVRLKQPGKGVHQQKHAALAQDGRNRWRQIRPRRRLRQLARGGHPQPALAQLRQQRAAVAPANQRAQPRPPMQEARQAGKQLVAAADAQGGVALRLPFDFDRRHVHLIGAFALAALATHAQLHGFGQPRVGKRRGAQLAIQRRLQRQHPRPRRVGDLAADAKAGAHHPLGRALAQPVANAHRHGAGKIAASGGDAGVGVALAGGFVAGPIQMVFHHGLLFTQRRALPSLQARTRP